MPEVETSGADGTPAAGTPPAAPTEGAPPESTPRTFSQDEVDGIIADRLRRAVPKDYDELKAQAEKYKADQAAKKTELERAQEEAKTAKAEAAETLVTANQRLRLAEIKTAAAEQNAVNPEMIAQLLDGSSDITIEKDGSIKGVNDAVKKLLASSPELVKTEKGTPSRSGGQFGGGQATGINDKIKEAEAKGDTKEVIRLKLQKRGT